MSLTEEAQYNNNMIENSLVRINSRSVPLPLLLPPIGADRTILAEEEVISLFRARKRERKRYHQYFTSIRKLRAQHYGIAFRRNKKEELLLGRDVLKKVIPKLEKTIQHYEHPDWYNRNGSVRKRAVTLINQP